MTHSCVTSVRSSSRQPASALRPVTTALTRAHDFDLVIADIAMPQMSGLEFLAALRVQTLHRHTPVIVLSAWTSEEVQNEAIRLGAVWLNKPATAAALVAWAERLTSGPTLAQEAS